MERAMLLLSYVDRVRMQESLLLLLVQICKNVLAAFFMHVLQYVQQNRISKVLINSTRNAYPSRFPCPISNAAVSISFFFLPLKFSRHPEGGD